VAAPPEVEKPPAPKKQYPEPPQGGTFRGLGSEEYLQMFRDLDYATHVHGMQGLKVIGDRTAIRGLAAVLKEASGRDRYGYDAVQVLASFGPTAHEALPPLKKTAEVWARAVQANYDGGKPITESVETEGLCVGLRTVLRAVKAIDPEEGSALHAGLKGRYPSLREVRLDSLMAAPRW
jgi:hypothetical protein